MERALLSKCCNKTVIATQRNSPTRPTNDIIPLQPHLPWGIQASVVHLIVVTFRQEFHCTVFPELHMHSTSHIRAIYNMYMLSLENQRDSIMWFLYWANHLPVTWFDRIVYACQCFHVGKQHTWDTKQQNFQFIEWAYFSCNLMTRWTIGMSRPLMRKTTISPTRIGSLREFVRKRRSPR